MTGGQHSTTTRAALRAPPRRQPGRPLDVCATVTERQRATSGAAPASTRTSPPGSPGRAFGQLRASRHLELCTAYFVPNNQASKTLTTILDGLGHGRPDCCRPSIPNRRGLPEGDPGAAHAAAAAAHRPIFRIALTRPFRLVVAEPQGVSRRPGSWGGGPPFRAVGGPARRLSDHGHDRAQHRRDRAQPPGDRIHLDRPDAADPAEKVSPSRSQLARHAPGGPGFALPGWPTSGRAPPSRSLASPGFRAVWEEHGPVQHRVGIEGTGRPADRRPSRRGDRQDSQYAERTPRRSGATMDRH